MFRKPADDDYTGGRLVKAKPLPSKYAQKLSMSGKDFVSSGREGGGAFTRHQEDQPSTSESPTCLTEDEKNKIHAKILKAEMKGDTETVNKLKRKLEGAETSSSEKSVVMLKRDRSGNVVPAQSIKRSSESSVKSSSHMQREFGKQQGVRDMVREEKASTAEDQLMLFHRAIIVS
ncbi:hypothetical protein Q1695_013872 [Nippostrongylus brasiliensis]|nr:hypothetical protein Q1695_013872 [Nippostrongylus brasiliensis]